MRKPRVLAKLARRGVRMILREVEEGVSKPYSFSGTLKIVQRMRKEIGLPKEFTLDACRHDGMTELEEMELTEGQGRALSAHRTKRADVFVAMHVGNRMDADLGIWRHVTLRARQEDKGACRVAFSRNVSGDLFLVHKHGDPETLVERPSAGIEIEAEDPPLCTKVTAEMDKVRIPNVTPELQDISEAPEDTGKFHRQTLRREQCDRDVQDECGSRHRAITTTSHRRSAQIQTASIAALCAGIGK